MLDARHWYALRLSAFFKLTMRFVSFDAIPHQLLLSLPTWFLLRSKIYPSFKYSTIIDATLQDLRIILPRFYHHWCYALRFSLQSPNIVDATDPEYSDTIGATVKDLLVKFPKSAVLHSKIFSSLFQKYATISDLLFTLQTSSMLRSKIFSGWFSHSNRIDAMLFTSFLSHCTIVDAML